MRMKSCLPYIALLAALVGGCSTVPSVSGPSKYRMVVVAGVDKPEKEFVELHERVLDHIVATDEPIDVKTKRSSVSGILRRDAAGRFSFKGVVKVYSSSADFDCPVVIGESFSPRTYGFSGGIHVFFVKFEEL